MYRLFVELADGSEKNVDVTSDATLDNCDRDILAGALERCLEEQHGLVIGVNLLHWEFV